MKINALLKTLTPLHIAAPGDLRIDASNGKIVNSKEATPLIGISRMPVVNPRFSPEIAAAGPVDDDEESLFADDVTEDEGVNKGPSDALDEKATEKSTGKSTEQQRPTIDVPVIAANNIAGHLRRHAAALVLDALRARGLKVSLPVYSCLQSGAWTGKPGSEDITYGEYLRAKVHPYLGLFGGGPRMMRKAFQTRSALPALPWLRETLHADVVQSAGPVADVPVWRLSKAAFFRRNDDLAELVSITQAQNSINDFDRVFDAYQDSILADKAKSQAARTSSFTFSAMEFVVPGVLFDAGFDLREDLTDAQVGLFLLTLDRFAERDRLGGAVRNGFGRFSMEVVELDGESIFSGGRLNRSHGDVQTYMAAWDEAAQKMTVEELDYLFRPGEKSKSSKKAEKDGEKKAETAFERLERLIAASA